MAAEYTYDDEGETWPFFIIAVMTFILVPLSVKYLYKIYDKNRGEKVIGEISKECKLVNEEVLTKFNSGSSKIFNKTLILLIIGWIILIYISRFTKQVNLIGSFDPYNILDVSITASEKEIKQRYRKLSLKFHPDKLKPGLDEITKELLELKFVNINLAYKSLTDEITKNNFIKYGHPDGPQEKSHGIALPKFLVDSNYSILLIISYFTLIGCILPFLVGNWWSNVKSHTKKGLHIETASLFTRKLLDRNPTKIVTPFTILDWILQSEEVAQILPNLDLEQLKELCSLHFERKIYGKNEGKEGKEGGKFSEGKLISTEGDNFIGDKEGGKFISNFEQVITIDKQVDVLKLINCLPKLINGLIEIATVFRSTDVVLPAVDLLKSIISAVKPCGKYQELLQLPYTNSNNIESQSVKKIGKLLTLSLDEQKKILGINNDLILLKTISIASKIPFIRIIEAKFIVPGESIVVPNSITHLSIKFLIKSQLFKSCPIINDTDLIDKETLPYLKDPLIINKLNPILPNSFAPHFPRPLKNEWLGFLINQKDNKIIDNFNVQHLSNLNLSNLNKSNNQWLNGDVIISTFKIPFGQTPNILGSHPYRLVLKNNAYFGNDVDIPVFLNIQPSPLKKMIIDNSNSDSDSDSDSDISDPEEDNLASAIKALKSFTDEKNNGKIQEINENDDENEDVFTDIDTDTDEE